MNAAATTVIVPVKGGPDGKSRLHRDPVVRAAFARAFARDTVAAALAAGRVGRVVVVTRDADTAAHFRGLGCQIVPERATLLATDPLNAAIALARDRLAQQCPERPVAVLPGDLPALTAAALDDALARARTHRLSFCADAAGTGTTLVVAACAAALTTAYGPDSARAHRAAGAVALRGVDRRVRQDIDTPEDLLAAERLGVGAATAAAHARIVAVTG